MTVDALRLVGWIAAMIHEVGFALGRLAHVRFVLFEFQIVRLEAGVVDGTQQLRLDYAAPLVFEALGVRHYEVPVRHLADHVGRNLQAESK